MEGKFNPGDQVIYQKELKGLPKDSIGTINTVHELGDEPSAGWCTITYPQYTPKDNGKGGYTYSDYVYAQSAKLEDIKLAQTTSA